ncbi:unnamed protein product [marine sediment metagenome]|uniref:Uncharacterized protein n=1 Tax=marine sediment metagenome TaxID=412755 RepID=X1LPQ0_9ZZZZ
MACENCTRLERMLFQLIAPGDTLQTLQPAISSRGIPLTPEMAVALDRLARPGQEAVAMKAVKTKRKASKYAVKYGKAFKKVAKKHMKKGGGWKTNGFKRAQKEAHKLAKRM